MSVQYAGNQFMSKRLIEVIQELQDYLGPEAQGLSDEAVVHKVMCQVPSGRHRSRDDNGPLLHC